MPDTFESIWNEVHGHSKSVDPFMVQSWVRDRWRVVAEARTWSWLRRRTAIAIPTPAVGTCVVTPGLSTVQISTGTLTETWIGRQFRVGNGHIYDVTNVDVNGGTITIEPVWSDTVVAAVGQACKVFTAYITSPDPDFFAWLSVTQPLARKKLRLNVNQETIDHYDAMRTMQNAVGPACLSGVDWTRSYAGRVFPAVAVGAAGVLLTSGTYTGSTDSIYIIVITLGGAIDTATFTYSKDGAAASPAVICSSIGNILPDGVGLQFDTAGVLLNQTWIVRVQPHPQYGMPRYEIYPHPTSAMYLSALIATRVHDIDEPGFVLPYTMRGDVIKLGALADMAGQYPGTDTKPNPFSQIARAQRLEVKFEQAVSDLMTADDAIMETNVSGPEEQYNWALLPWMNASGYGFRPTATMDPLDLVR